MTAIDGEMSLGGKLEPMLTLSWLVRVQVGAKRGKLTLLGGVRGTKLELKGALGEPKSAPRASQEHPKRVSGASAAQTSSFIAFRGSRRPKPRVCTVSNLAFYSVWGTVAAQTSNFTLRVTPPTQIILPVLRVSVMRELVQPIAPSALSAFRAVDRGGASRRFWGGVLFSSLREDWLIASWREKEEGAGCAALVDLVFGIFSDSSWTAFGRLSECSRSCAWVDQKPLKVAPESPKSTLGGP